MTPSQAVSVCFSKYFDFTGRATRSEFWWFYAFQFAVGSIISIIGDIGVINELVTLTVICGLINTIFSLVLMFPNMTVAARRLHDIGKSGWWQILPLAGAPGILISAISLAFLTDASPFFGVMLLILITNFIFMMIAAIFNIIQWIRPSQPGTNKWG